MTEKGPPLLRRNGGYEGHTIGTYTDAPTEINRSVLCASCTDRILFSSSTRLRSHAPKAPLMLRYVRGVSLQAASHKPPGLRSLDLSRYTRARMCNSIYRFQSDSESSHEAPYLATPGKARTAQLPFLAELPVLGVRVRNA